MFKLLPKIILLSFVAANASVPMSAAESPTRSTDLPWATVTTPSSATVGEKVPLVINIKPGAVPRDGKLSVDVHLFVGKDRTPIGAVAGPFDIKAGEAREIRVESVVPDRPGTIAMHYVFYISPDGRWEGNFLNGDVGIALRQPPPDPRKDPMVQVVPLAIAQPPETKLSPVRSEIVLNGPWRFRPALDDQAAADDERWGQIWVPGSWKPNNLLPGLIRKGIDDSWASFGPELASAWYERRVAIPADWKGRAILLDLSRISTDAVVYANGKECGHIEWPSGSVAISDAVEAGKEAVVQIRVFAEGEEGMKIKQMGTGAAGDLAVKADLETRGIIGDVVLASRPRGAHIEDVFVQPSVTSKRLACRVTVRGAQAGEVAFTAHLLDEEGKIEKTFTASAPVKAEDGQTVDLAWDWADPRLWDVRQPNIYTLRLEAKGAGLDDDYSQRFGFREFSIKGTGFQLNGRNIRLRPALAPTSTWNFIGAVREAVDAATASLLEWGFNTLELWPNDFTERGVYGYGVWDAWCDSADRHGMLLMAPAPHFPLAYDKTTASAGWSAEQGVAYRAAVERHLRRVRNHPSVVLWGVNANEFFFHDAENPRNIGRSGWAGDGAKDYRGYRYADMVEAGAAAIADFKQVDPTRPVYTHHGGYVGEINTQNLYLNLIPLQEREDWLSHFAEHGTMPFIPIEFGTPVEVSFLRSRTSNFGNSLSGEPLMSEFCATYLGADSFRQEAPDYRAGLRERYNAASKNWGHWWGFTDKLRFSPNHQSLQDLFIRNTWRSWRTWGTAGGMLPWTEAHGVQHPEGKVALPPFAPGRRGTWFPEMSRKGRFYKDHTQGARITPAGEALRANNGPTLAYLAGPAKEFTAKDHIFTPGETVEKCIAIINDEVHPAPEWTATWSAELAGQTVGGGKLSGAVESGSTLLEPVRFTIPSDIGRADGEIKLEVRIGAAVHHDRFPIRVHPKPAAPPATAREVAVFDPEGKTTELLSSLGFKCTPWNGSQVPLLVVGRNALSGDTGGKSLPGDIESYVRNGGRLLISNQDPGWASEVIGLRTSKHVTRRAWPVRADHPITVGLEGEDFRDWRGAGTAYPDEIGTDGHGQRWSAGWHWGNRGSVASSVPEKPHAGSWKPILESNFDLMYAPLMEAQIGKGIALWCALDIEGRTVAEPMAGIVTRRMLDYLAEASLEGPALVGYLGDDGGRKLLDSMGVEHTPAASGVSTLVVVGEGVGDDALAPFTAMGTPILVLSRQKEGKAPFGAVIESRPLFKGSLAAPDWPETQGITASDLRFRTERPWRVLSDGCDIAADGLLGRKTVDKSTVIYCQLDPEALEADQLPYVRYTRWRHQRAISNLLANFGADFASDGNFFLTAMPELPLPTEWRAKLMTSLPPALEPDKGHADPGMSSEARVGVSLGFDDSSWNTITIGTPLPELDDVDGEAVYRMVVDVPAELAGQDLDLILGVIDDFDTTFWNGKQIGETDDKTPGYWEAKRVYRVPGELVKAGKTEIAVRLFDRFSAGGMFAKPGEAVLRQVRTGQRGPLYHPDYVTIHWRGDDPTRWCPW